jgi:hypothetical protein
VEAQPITFKLHDESAGYAVSPQRVPLAMLKAFADDVADLVRGEGSKQAGGGVEVSVIAGSLGLQTEPLSDPGLFADLRRLSVDQRLDGIGPRRRAVLEKWQARARKAPQVRFEIASPALAAPLVISAATDYRTKAADQWVRVERYVQGEVEDLGGSDRVNAHIRLAGGERLMVDTDRAVLRDDKVNRLYKSSMVRISAEYNVATRQHRNARLIEFVDYAPQFDEAEFERMTTVGRQAWKDVPDASAWVDALRGHGE